MLLIVHSPVHNLGTNPTARDCLLFVSTGILIIDHSALTAIPASAVRLTNKRAVRRDAGTSSQGLTRWNGTRFVTCSVRDGVVWMGSAAINEAILGVATQVTLRRFDTFSRSGLRRWRLVIIIRVVVHVFQGPFQAGDVRMIRMDSMERRLEKYL